MINRSRYALWGGGLVLAAAVVYLAPPAESDSVVVPAKPQQPSSEVLAVQASNVARAAPNHLLRISSRFEASEAAFVFSDNFSQAKALPRASVSVAPSPPPVAPPQAPNLPFRYVGRYVENGQAKFFLQNGDQDLVVKVGELIDKTYKVEAVNATNLTFIYLPLNVQQSLSIGTAQ